jgi:murein L,D-transpeptidase YafK
MRCSRWLQPLEMRSRVIASSVGLACLFASIGCSSQQSNLDTPKIDRIEILKSKHQLILFADGKPVKSYPVALGRSNGPKRRQGDHKTPEGQYLIDQKIAKSRFHLALHVSYPNPADRKWAQDAGVDPGGAIEIHGVERQFAWLGPLQHDWDWTDGCIAVTNREIEEIWRLAPVGTPVEIKP